MESRVQFYQYILLVIVNPFKPFYSQVLQYKSWMSASPNFEKLKSNDNYTKPSFIKPVNQCNGIWLSLFCYTWFLPPLQI